jgi:hypothetical protein
MTLKNMKFDTVIFNVNHSHPKTPTHHRLDLKTNTDYKVGILQNSNTFKEFPDKFNPKTSITGFFQYKGLPRYFDMPLKNFKIYMDRVEKLILLAKLISKNVIIYETPHASKEVKRLNLNIKDMNMLSDKTKEICSKQDVIFLKPKITDNKYFNDIVHFSKKGHIQMAEILYETIENNK